MFSDGARKDHLHIPFGVIYPVTPHPNSAALYSQYITEIFAMIDLQEDCFFLWTSTNPWCLGKSSAIFIIVSLLLFCDSVFRAGIAALWSSY